ncbi:DUF6602 domain-containing protein [Pseudomonas sp. T8]|uniref:DUF6602 domain-containing protein n=1 Tax=Pseudomonas sp. T8 TaxID=645292 RepID=UPI00214896DD|nr:DUF6602 domain-containing protein [Pseudomonas sp. T8]UUT23494.1 hypothetical protein NRG23_05895 [Pseudomonas sp. T8]
MNDDQFRKKIRSELGTQQCNFTFLPKWNRETLEGLSSAFKQKELIKHPRHRGDSRELDFIEILSSSIPASIRISKGFGLNTSSLVSHEQDCLLLNTESAWALAGGGGVSYFPIESILGSIEVKSRLTISELRKSILNCVSLKKVLYPGLPYSEEKKPKERICYSIFAYSSSIELSKLPKVIRELQRDIPPALRINMIYLLGKGLILPGDGSYELNFEQIHRNDLDFGALDGLRSDYFSADAALRDHTVTFQWFIANNIDHCLFERSIRKIPSYSSYVFHPISIQMSLEKIFNEHNSKSAERKV